VQSTLDVDPARWVNSMAGACAMMGFWWPGRRRDARSKTMGQRSLSGRNAECRMFNNQCTGNLFEHWELGVGHWILIEGRVWAAAQGQ